MLSPRRIVGFPLAGLTRGAPRARIATPMTVPLCVILLQSSAAAAAGAAEETGPFRSSPFVWIAAAILLAAAVYFIIRLLELDLMNEGTPNQDDPLS